MTPARILAVAVALVAALVAAPGMSEARLSAQATVNLDEAIGRARTMVENGNGRGGRLMLDSLVQQASTSAPALGELLYWRGLLAESGADAERDWRRLLLEVPMSPRAEDAMLRLAQLELLRGKPMESRAFLETMVRDYPDPASQARAHYWLARAWSDENDTPRACGALEVVLRDAPQNAVELRAQADALRGQCRGVTAMSPLTSATRTVTVPGTVVQAAEPPRQEVVAQAPPVVRDTTPTRVVPTPVPVASPPSTPPPRAAAQPAPTRVEPAPSSSTQTGSTARPANARFSVQLAAYQRRDQAEALVRTLAGRNIDARVDGDAAPFRVRTGYYSTRTQAANRLAELKRGGHDGFVAELTP